MALLEETSVTYDHVVKHCPSCGRDTLHALSIAWGGEEGYNEKDTCVSCRYVTSQPSTREACGAINGLALDLPSN